MQKIRKIYWKQYMHTYQQNLVDVIIKIHGGMMNEEVENNGNN